LTEHRCCHHGGGGCGAQWAFPPTEGILPMARSIAWRTREGTIHPRGARIPLDHPPKAIIAH
jgi:hypothetical protein